MKKFFLNWITEPDNKTFCPVRFLSIVAVVEFLALAVHTFYRTSAFDMQGFGTGFAALIAGVVVALGLKKDTPVTDAKQS
jgi:hypothetical protein